MTLYDSHRAPLRRLYPAEVEKDERPRRWTRIDWAILLIVAFVLVPWVVWQCLDAWGRM